MRVLAAPNCKAAAEAPAPSLIPPTPDRFLAAPSFVNDGIEIHVQGQAGKFYRIDASSDLRHWSWLGSFFGANSATALWEWRKGAARFYRARETTAERVRPAIFGQLTLVPDFGSSRKVLRDSSQPRAVSVFLFSDLTGILAFEGAPTDPFSLAPVTHFRFGNLTVVQYDTLILIQRPELLLALRGGTLRFEYSDDNADGVMDFCAGQATGTWEVSEEEKFLDRGVFGGSISVQPRTTGPRAGIRGPIGPDPLGRSGMFTISFNDPVWLHDLQNRVRVLANGSPTAGRIVAKEVINGLVRGVWFTHPNEIPFGAEVTLDLGGLRDPFGHPATWDGKSLPILKDFGSLLDNASFEADLSHWHAAGSVAVSGAFHGLDPADGAGQSILTSTDLERGTLGAKLVGQLAVPAEASELSFSAAVLRRRPFSTEVVIRVHAKGQSHAIFLARDHDQSAVPCDCEPYNARIGPWRVGLDLRPYRGQTILIAAEVEPRINGFSALLIDDFRIR